MSTVVDISVLRVNIVHITHMYIHIVKCHSKQTDVWRMYTSKWKLFKLQLTKEEENVETDDTEDPDPYVRAVTWLWSSRPTCWRSLWSFVNCNEMKWNESGFRPPLCTYRLNWARRTSWGWWDDWDDTVLQTQNSKFEPWRSEAEHATSRSRRLPTILTFTRGWGRNIFCFLQTAETGNRTPDSGVKGSGANHYPRAPARC